MNKSKIIRIISLFLSLVFIFSFSACNGNNGELEFEYYQNAKKYLEQGEYKKALKTVDKGLAEVGDSLFLSSLKDDIKKAQNDAENEETTHEAVLVPDLIGVHIDEAIQILNSMNIDAIIKYEYSEIFYADTIIRTDPTFNTELTMDPEESSYSVVLYVAQTPVTVIPEVTLPAKVTAKNATFVFNERLYPAHTYSEMGFTEMPYVDNGYLVMNFWYESTDGMNWSEIATVLVENQILGASISSSDYHVEANEKYYFSIIVPVSNLYNQYPYYLEMDFNVGNDHNMFINVTIIW